MSQPGTVKPDDIDAVIHERVRLAILSALAVTQEMSFAELKTALEVTDGNLSAHARVLADAGYVTISKSFLDRKPHTALVLTAAGREAFEQYLESLRRILAQSGSPGNSTG